VRKDTKQQMSVFGYKHVKSIKFYAYLYRCLRDCYEQKYEQLNVDMNNFLLLKNELSLGFLRNYENIVQTVKAAIKIYASQEELERKDTEAQELQLLEKILKN
jgi:predicted metal-binding transcription factor (methanogenesis marker protein 9)